MNLTFSPSHHRRHTITVVAAILGLSMLFPSLAQEEQTTGEIIQLEREKAAGDIIQIDRPLTVGSAFYEKTTLKYSSDVLAMDENNERFVENPTSTVEFEADQLILATTPSGYAKELMMRVDKLKSLPAKENNAARTLLKPGTYIHAIAAEDGCTFSIDGKVIDDEDTQQVLDDLIGLLEEDPPVNREDMLLTGEKHPRKPGERWFLDRASLAKLMTSDEFDISPSDVSGSALYHGIVEARGTECQRLTYTNAVQIGSNLDPNPRRYFRSITLNLPTDTSLMERSFELRRWTRIDQKFNNAAMIFQGVRSIVYLLDYYTEIDLITDEEVLTKLREAHQSHLTKAAAQEKQEEKTPEEVETPESKDQPKPANESND